MRRKLPHSLSPFARIWVLIALAGSLLGLAATPAHADELRPGYIELVQQDASRWTMSWKQPLSSPGRAVLIEPQVPQNCAYDGRPTRRQAAMALLGAVDLICKGDISGGRIGSPALVATGDTLVRVAPLGRNPQAYRLTASEPYAVIQPRASAAQVWRSYFVIGVEHILFGWDHLLFVIALVLLVRRPWAVVKAATAFTVAHSITLAGASLGLVGLPQRPVEALIALSIVFLAVELARTLPRSPFVSSERGLEMARPESLTTRLPWLVAFLFGLLHGFGFAGALREIGLPEGEVPAALLSFNLGVEAGQLLIIALVLALLWLIARAREAALAPAVRIASYGIGITGAYWLFDRVIG